MSQSSSHSQTLESLTPTSDLNKQAEEQRADHPLAEVVVEATYYSALIADANLRNTPDPTTIVQTTDGSLTTPLDAATENSPLFITQPDVDNLHTVSSMASSAPTDAIDSSLLFDTSSSAVSSELGVHTTNIAADGTATIIDQALTMASSAGDSMLNAASGAADVVGTVASQAAGSAVELAGSAVEVAGVILEGIFSGLS